MALPLPTLTFAQGAYVSTGSLTPTTQQVIDAISTAIASATYWEEVSKTANYIEISPKSGSAVTDIKILIAGAPGTSADLVPDTSVAGIWCGIAPDGGTLGTWNTATPYSGARWAGYWSCAPDALIESVYILESDETIYIGFRDDSLDNMYGVYLGALWEGLDAGSTEADDRIYGMITGGNTPIHDAFWGNTGEMFTHNTANKAPHTGLFRPSVPATWDTAERVMGGTIVAGTTMITLGGTLVNLPVHHQVEDSPQYFVGRLRQVYLTKDSTNRTVLADGVPATQGYVVSGDNITAVDAALFGNA
jgi:hypothetical protein